LDPYRLFWRIGLTGFTAWVLLLLVVEAELILLIEGNLSPDGQVADSSVVLAKLTAALVFGWLLLPIPWLTWRPAAVTAAFRNSSSFDRVETLLVLALLSASVIAIFQWGRWQSLENAGWLATGKLHGEDGFMENLTAGFALAASVILMIAARGLTRGSRILVLALALASFFFGMEEISWGQRIFGVATPEVLVEANHQGELNLHNFLSPRQVHLYTPVAVNLLLAAYFCFAHPLATLFPDDLRPLTLPAHSLILSLVFQFLLVQSVIMYSAEVTEEVVSVVLFFSAMRLLRDHPRRRHLRKTESARRRVEAVDDAAPDTYSRPRSGRSE